MQPDPGSNSALRRHPGARRVDIPAVSPPDSRTAGQPRTGGSPRLAGPGRVFLARLRATAHWLENSWLGDLIGAACLFATAYLLLIAAAVLG
ncbi:MAG: hypothetical protein Q4G49_03230 [Paracoccus sp. (in: a-proteobacteria)]|nr:hypothetical protein [Paracoccus sp. (in: a-proteobacteria)]